MSISALPALSGGEPRATPADRVDDRHPGSSRQGDPRYRQSWAETLEALEGDVLSAEQTLAHASEAEIAAWGRRATDWVPPSGLGTIPADLRERAARLLQHQLAVAEALVDGILQSRKQRDLAARMSQTPTRPVASFIDRPV